MLHDSGRVVLAAARRAAREADAPLLLAVSGGLDSMAMLHAMAAVVRSQIALVATFDHGTGRASTAAAAHVARSAASLGLPVVVGCLPPDQPTAGGREAAWRRARYDFLRASAAPLGARIVTAHTEDDQVETVLMRMMRSSGARGLAGLYAPGEIVRPFLGLRRAELAAFARAERVQWREDASNRSLAFVRNRVRRELLPALRRADPSIEVHLLDVARRAAAWRAQVDALVETRLGARMTSRDAIAVPRAELLGLDPDSLAMIWASVAARAGLALDRRGTRRLTSFTMTDRRQGSIPLSGGWRVEATVEDFVLRRVPAQTAASVLPREGSLDWGAFRFRIEGRDAPAFRTASWADRVWSAALPAAADAVVRSWSAGDRLAPAAGQQRRRVRRYLSDAGVHGVDRAGWPVVVAGDDVVWIPGVRRSDAATERSGRPVRYYVCERIDR